MPHIDLQKIRKELGELPIPKIQRPNRTNLMYWLLSLVFAVFLWCYIATTIKSDYSVSFSKIPVQINLAGTKAESYGLTIMPTADGSEMNMTVDATLNSTRAAIGALNRSDLVAYVDFDSDVENTVGIQTFPIRLRTTTGNFSEQNVDIKLSSSFIELEMDRYEYLTVNVNDIQYPNLRYDEETRISTDGITVVPSTVQIYGPSTQLKKLNHIRVTVDDNEELLQTKTFSGCSNFALIDADGNELPKEAFSMPTTRFDVRIPVFYSKQLPVTINVSNLPDSFDAATIMQRIRLNVNGISYTLPQYGENNLMMTIETTAPDEKAQLDGLEAWQIDTIPLSQLSVNSSIPVTISMPEGYSDSTNLGTVYIMLDSTELVAETRWIKNSDIVFMNDNQKYRYVLESPGGNTPITLIGTPEELEKISSEDIKTSVNLVNISVSSEGVYTQSFSVTLPEQVKGVWVSPVPTINIVVTVA